jgi:hypothetical protein
MPAAPPSSIKGKGTLGSNPAVRLYGILGVNIDVILLPPSEAAECGLKPLWTAAVHFGAVIPEIDIWRGAQLMRKRYGCFGCIPRRPGPELKHWQPDLAERDHHSPFRWSHCSLAAAAQRSLAKAKLHPYPTPTDAAPWLLPMSTPAAISPPDIRPK